MSSKEQGLTNLIFTMGYSMQDRAQGAYFSGINNEIFPIECVPLNITVPYHGHIFEQYEIEQLIEFLQKQLKEMRKCHTEK